MIRDHLTTVGPFKTRYLEAGLPTAPCLLLLHDGAWGGAADVTWSNVIAALAEQYHVLAPDLLGFGGSAKAVFLDQSPYDFRIAHLCAFLDQMGQDKVHLIGSSFGGSIGVEMLAQCPERLLSIMTISGTGGPWRSELGRRELATWDGTDADLDRIIDLLVEDTGHYDRAAQKAARLKWAAQAGHLRAMNAPGLALPAGISSGLKPNPDFPLNLQAADVPVCVLAGSRDLLVDPDWPEQLARGLKRGEIHRMDCRHSPNIDHPQEFSRFALEWLARAATL